MSGLLMWKFDFFVFTGHIEHSYSCLNRGCIQGIWITWLPEVFCCVHEGIVRFIVTGWVLDPVFETEFRWNLLSRFCLCRSLFFALIHNLNFFNTQPSFFQYTTSFFVIHNLHLVIEKGHDPRSQVDSFHVTDCHNRKLLNLKHKNIVRLNFHLKDRHFLVFWVM